MEKFTKTNRDAIRERNERDTEKKTTDLIKEITSQGYEVTFGTIGKKTTYCLLTRGEDEEIVGYTFIKDSKYLNEKVGKLKALQQAVTRKELLDERSREESEQA